MQNPEFPKFESKEARLESLKQYPKGFPPIEKLADAGFFYSGKGGDDDCQCYFCGVKLIRWMSGDDPVTEHRNFRADCPLLADPPIATPITSHNLGVSNMTHAPNILSSNPSNVFRGQTYPSQPGTTIPHQIEVDTMPHSKQDLYSSIRGGHREQSGGLGQSKKETNVRLYASVHDSNAISEPPSDAMPPNQPHAPPVENYSSTNTPNNVPRYMKDPSKQAIYSTPHSANISSESSSIPQNPEPRKLDLDSQEVRPQYPYVNDGSIIRSGQLNNSQMLHYQNAYYAHQNAYYLPQPSHHYRQSHYNQPYSPNKLREVNENYFSYQPENRAPPQERIKSNYMDLNQEKPYNQSFQTPNYSKQTNNTYPQIVPSSIRPQMSHFPGDYQY